ncbi:MAG: asparagine synthase (glutamine-hydrolyzing), partial [Pseudomonadota bacterium]|nr:asparagine synthase (glutamine-hydrolyzing) [Pseudomonadota bacterium]
AQPMADAEGRFWITYNGEIYNYRELKAELDQSGEIFRTRSDTEVILAAYRRWGNDCWSRMRGMWALAIWDRQRDEFIFSRDRFGIKPLYFHAAGDQLIFASEIKTILAALPQAPAVSRAAAVQFLEYGLLDHLPQTFWHGITPFPPASYAVVPRAGLESVTPQRYWQISPAATPENFTAATERYRELFSEAMKDHLVSDVPVGFCLSGGMDSSAIACMARTLASGASLFNAYTAAYENFARDERRWAHLAASAANATPHDVFPDAETLCNDWEQLLWHQEQPFGGLSVFAQWCVMKRVKQTGIKVVLDGQGADESLCGYRKFYYFYLLDLFRKRRWGRLAGESAALLLHGDRRILHIPPTSRHRPGWLRNQGRSPIVHLGDVSRERTAFQWQPSAKKNLAEWQRDDLHTLSLPALLRYEDRNAMAFSVESRVPFLDHRLVEYSLSLPDEFKLRNGRTKAALRRAMTGIVPDAILRRRTKVGFEVPQEKWLKGALSERLRHSLLDDFRIEGWLDKNAAREGLNQFLQGGGAADAVARLFILNEWARRFSVHI